STAPAPPPGRGLCFGSCAAGGRALIGDAATSEGADMLDELASRADVLIETGPPGATAALRERHPRLIVASITPFGQSGPYRDWRASDLVAQAACGTSARSGPADRTQGRPVATLPRHPPP